MKLLSKRKLVQTTAIICTSLAIGYYPLSVSAEQHDVNNNKVIDRLEEMVENGTYYTYKDTDLVDIIIGYREIPSDEDKSAINNLGGKYEPGSHDRGLHVGLSKEHIENYAKRDNVKYIQPNYRLGIMR